MRNVKIAFGITAIALVAFLIVVAALAMAGKVAFATDTATASILGAIGTIVLAILNAKHIFNDPEAVIELKSLHADEMLRMKAAHVEAMAKAHRECAASVVELQKKHDDLMAKAEKEKERLRKLWNEAQPKEKPLSGDRPNTGMT